MPVRACWVLLLSLAAVCSVAFTNDLDSAAALRRRIRKRIQTQSSKSGRSATPASRPQPDDSSPLRKRVEKLLRKGKQTATEKPSAPSRPSPSSSPGKAANISLKVLLTKVSGASTLRISGRGDAAYHAVPAKQAGRALWTSLRGEMQVSGRGDKVVISGQPNPYLDIRARTAVVLNGRAYRGRFHITSRAGRLRVVNTVPLNHYLYGVLPYEVSARWPRETLKAMAVVARTYALKRSEAPLHSDYQLDDTVRCQVYGGMRKEAPSVNRAVEETKGRVIIYQNRLIRAVFHSNCGGRTANASDIWGGDMPYCRSVPCEFGKDGAYYQWEEAIRLPRVYLKLKGLDRKSVLGNGLTSVSVTERFSGGRAQTVMLKGKSGKFLSISGKRFRARLGYNTVKSLRFSVNIVSGMMKLAGRGHGHGVGLCQWGARGMGRAGYTHEQIIRKYYTSVSLTSYRRLEERP